MCIASSVLSRKGILFHFKMIPTAHIAVLTLIVLIHDCAAQLSSDKDKLLNWCLKSKNHKHDPGREDSLHQQCRPWKDHACCTENVTLDVHSTNMYNFTYDHCQSQTGRNMSEQCRRHFVQDSCFYECEPNIGLWVVGVDRKIASERFYEVPLCASDCEAWFEDCKDDFTCAYNWPRDFKFSKGQNTCKENSKCQTFKETYREAKDFCENVWDHSWQYTSDDKPCIHVWFDENSENPNRKVAEYYIAQRFETAAAGSLHLSLGLLMLGVVVTLGWN